VDENCPLTGTATQTCDSNNGEDNWNLNQHETSEASDVLRIPKLLEKDDDSRTRSLPPQGIENGGHVTPSLTASQQAVILAFCLLIEKSSRHDELQRKLLQFLHSCMHIRISHAYLIDINPFFKHVLWTNVVL